jgi:hypothetical protein
MAVNRQAPSVEEYLIENEDFSIDDRPVSSVKQTTSPTTAVGEGWDAGDSLSTPAGDYPVEMKLNEDFQVIKFLDPDGPFATYKQHFLSQKTVGRRSYIALGADDPLAIKLNSKPEDKRAFTVANLSAVGGAQRQMLIATPRLYKTLHAAHFSPQGPLNKVYWAISRTGKMQQTVYHLTPIKGRDLMEDWAIDEAEAEAAIKDMTCYTRADIKTHSWEELDEIANSLLG